MLHRQSMPEQWFILDRAPGERAWLTLLELPRGSGLLVLCQLDAKDRRRVRNLEGWRRLTVVSEQPGVAARVHNVRELGAALQRRTRLILLSPLYRTASHPDWKPVPRMRAAALACLARRRLLALGGMNARRYAKIAPLGFVGWAGISAWRAQPSRE